ncbi:MAG: cadherin-like domain-containing protein, partial [Hyphomicrobiales bacterium]
MSTSKPTNSDVKAKPTDGQGNVGSKESSRLSDDAHDFVLKDTPVDGANQNLGNAHEGNYNFAARMGSSSQIGENDKDALNDTRPFTETSSSMLSDQLFDSNAASLEPQNRQDHQTANAASENEASPQSINTLFSQDAAAFSTSPIQVAHLSKGATRPSDPNIITGNSDVTPVDTPNGGSSGGGESPEEENSAPIALDLFASSTDEDTSQIITQEMLLTTFQDADGDTLTVNNVSVGGGTITDNGDGTWTFTPDPEFNGDVSISFDVSDGQSTTPGTGIINVKPINDGPAAGNVDLGATAEDTSVTFSEADLLANSSDIDGDTLSVTSV